MHKIKRSLLSGGVAALLLAAGQVSAQETGNTIGPPQLRDFSLQPQQRIVTQPQTPAPPPVQVTPPPPTQAQPAAPAQPRTPAREDARRTPEQQRAPEQAPTQSAPTPEPATPAAGEAPAPLPAPALVPEAVEPETRPAATPTDEAPAGTPYWLYAIGLAALAFAAFALLRRRRRLEEGTAEAPVAPAPAVAAPPPRSEPGPRPWIEIEVKAERAAFTREEATVNFELSITNSGPVAARNLRVDVKLINAGQEQDKEIGAFFRTAGRDTTKLNLPGIGADSTGVIQGEVGMPVADMRAVTLDGRMLFIPVLAVNILYEWGDGRLGQTSKSYVVGRELETTSEKMGAFRVDQGPRIWRTVGQRPHKLARRI